MPNDTKTAARTTATVGGAAVDAAGAATATETPEAVVATPVATVAPAETLEMLSPDIAARIARATKLAHLTAPDVSSNHPLEPSGQEPGPYGQQPVVVSGGQQFDVPALTIPEGFSGIQHNWFPDGEPFRVIQLSFPMLVKNGALNPYQVATFGDVVILDEATAQFGLKHKSIEPI